MDWARQQLAMKRLKHDGKRRVTRDELRKHTSRDDLWMAVRGKVYDVTSYLRFHPGGIEELMRGAGEDATAIFNQVHRWVQVENMLARHVVGTLIEEDEKEDDVDEEWQAFDVIRTRCVARNTVLMTCRFEREASWPFASFSVGDHLHLTVRTKDRGSTQPYRAYTPVDVRPDDREIDFVIKIYADGKLTPLLGRLRPRDEILMRGPRGTIRYDDCAIHTKPNGRVRATYINMICGGTGVTPMLQIVRHIVEDRRKDEEPLVKLLFANRTREDVILREELDKLSEDDRVNVRFLLTGASSSSSDDDDKKSSYIFGKVNEDVIRSATFKSGEKGVVSLICGPPGFNRAVREVLKRLGHDASTVLEF